MQSRIASIGYREDLLAARNQALAAAGFAVEHAGNFLQGRAMLRATPFDVLVLGYSVPEQERTLLALEAKRANPNACIVFLYLTEIRNAELGDAVINVTSGNTDLVSTVRHLLEQGQGAAIRAAR